MVIPERAGRPSCRAPTATYRGRVNAEGHPAPDARRARATLVDRRVITVDAPPEATFRAVERIGGEYGWPYADPLWRIRGWLDRLVGGAGMRGRPSNDELAEGHPLDFWHVERLDRPRQLRLRAEMRLPGSAWLEFSVEPDGDGSRLVQTAVFHPAGLAGRAYWYGLYPIHVLIFRGMVRRLAERAARGRPRG